MKQKKPGFTDEKGMVLVLSIFMLALLSMIGVAAMMTGTTEIDISANEKFHKIAFYQAESGLTIGTELIELMGGYDSVFDNSYFDDNETIKVLDGSFLFETKDVPTGSGVWEKDNQTDWVNLRDSSSNPDIQLMQPFNANIDVDKIAVRHLAGGGAEFGSGSQGIGVATHRIIYNIDCIGGLSEGRFIPVNHIMGFQFIPRF